MKKDTRSIIILTAICLILFVLMIVALKWSFNVNPELQGLWY